MKKAIIVAILALCAAAAVFAGPKQESSGGAKKPVTLTVLWFNDANESDIFLSTVQDYVAANSNVKIDMQVVAFGDYEQKIRTMLSGGTPPDLARVTEGHIARFGSAMLQLDPYISGLADMKKNFLPAALEYVTSKEGKLLGLPTDATANGMLVNKTAFKNAGIDVDAVSKTWTWASWEDTVKKVIAANSSLKYGLALDYTHHRLATILYQFGGHILNSNQTKVDFNNEGNLEAIRFIKKLHDNGLMPRSVWMGSENAAELFQAGLVACHIGGSWNINAYNKNVQNFEWGAVMMPLGKIHSSVPGGKHIASFKDAAHKEEAVSLMLAFSDQEHNARYALGTFNIPARTDARVSYPSNTADFNIFNDELKVTPAFTAAEFKNPLVSGLNVFIREQVAEVLLGKISPETAAKNIDEKGASL
jgi:alpha-1,4-digalacturonate transport system substrate-binding protein